MTMTARHPLVEDYLRSLWAEAARLPVDQARELVVDIEEHLRAALPADASETQVRNVLDRLGHPQELVSEAAAVPDQDPAGTPTAPARSFASPWGAIACLVAAELLFVTGYIGIALWVIGLVLMARATVWEPRDKVLGFAVLGSGLPVVYVAVFAVFVSSPGCVMSLANAGGFCESPPTSIWVLVVGYLAVQAVVTWRLARSARRG